LSSEELKQYNDEHCGNQEENNTLSDMRTTRCGCALLAGVGLCLLAGAKPPVVRKTAHWPLDEGTGQVVRDRVGDVNGAFRTQEAGRELKWGREAGRAVLLFPGSEADIGGHLEIARGGAILRGPVFALGLEVRLDKSFNAGYLLTCKHGQKKVHGFTLHYWAGNRKLSFSFGDGTRKHDFALRLKKRLPTGKWLPLCVLYDGRTLRIEADGQVVGSFERPGLALSPSDDPLLVGSYFNKLGGPSLHGAVRNVWLGVPKVRNRPMLHNADLAKPAPVIDGKLDDPCWRAAAFVGGFVKLGGTQLAKPATRFAIAGDAEHLYVAFQCAQPRMKDIFLAAKTRDSQKMFADDSIELFIDPDAGGRYYIHLGLTAANVQFDALQTNETRVDFDMPWRSAVRRGPREWTAEIAIPYAGLLAKPEGAGFWRFNICRNNSVGEQWDRYSTWGRPSGNEKVIRFHDRRLFGTLLGLPKPAYDAKAVAFVKAGRRRWGLDKKPIVSKIALYPIHEPLFVANNLVVPNLLLNKAPGKVVMALKARYTLDLPEGVQLLHVGRVSGTQTIGGGTADYEVRKEKDVVHEGRTHTRYIVRPVNIHRNQTQFSPLYMTSPLPDGTRTQMYAGATWEGGKQPIRKIAVVVRTFPTPGRPMKLVSSIGWMFDANNLAWPDMLDNYAKLGFNTVSSHYGYDGLIPLEKRKPFWHKARQHGMKLLCVGSPFYSVEHRAEGNSTKPDGTPVAEHDGCPAYRGPLFQDDMRKLREAVKAMRPDIVNLDIECYKLGAFRGRTGGCARCGAYVRKSGKPPAEAVTDLGTDILVQCRKALAEAVPPPLPTLGIYHTKPGGFTYQDTFNFDKMLAAGAVQYCQPVGYRTSKAGAWGVELRVHRQGLKAAQVMPWMTTGYSTQVEYPSEWVYDYVLEAYGSGVGGIFWFAFPSMEGADYYYHAKAMEAVVPVAEIIYDSVPIEGIRSRQPGFSVTGLRRGKDVLLLVSNYDKPAPAEVTATLPFASAGGVWDLARKRAGGSVDGRTVTIRFQPGASGAHTALYYVGSMKF